MRDALVACPSFVEYEVHDAGRTISMFGDMQFRAPLILFGKFVKTIISISSFTIQKEYYVSVLLDAVVDEDIIGNEVVSIFNRRIKYLLNPQRSDGYYGIPNYI